MVGRDRARRVGYGAPSGRPTLNGYGISKSALAAYLFNVASDLASYLL